MFLCSGSYAILTEVEAVPVLHRVMPLVFRPKRHTQAKGRKHMTMEKVANVFTYVWQLQQLVNRRGEAKEPSAMV